MARHDLSSNTLGGFAFEHFFTLLYTYYTACECLLGLLFKHLHTPFPLLFEKQHYENDHYTAVNMPYIGASNSSHNSFMSLKEKHSIKKTVSSSQSPLSSVPNESDSTIPVKEERSTDLSLNDTVGSKDTIPAGPSSEKPIPESEESIDPVERALNNNRLSSSAANEENISSELTSANMTPVPSEMKLQNLEKHIYNPINRSKSIDSTISNLSDVDLHELYNLPNESTHSYSYNPLSPNSLAVRLSILKRSLEIIISNPGMLEDGTMEGQTVGLMHSAAAAPEQDHLNIRKTRHQNSDASGHDPTAEEPNDIQVGGVRQLRSMSLSVSDNIPKYSPSQKWTSPTAALNAFVSNYHQSAANLRNNTEPDIKSSRTMNNISRTPLNSISYGNSGNNPNNSISIPLAHRANSLAYLPKIMSSYNIRNKVAGFREPALRRQVTSRINFREPFRETSDENIASPSANDTMEAPDNSLVNNVTDDSVAESGTTEYISEQRENLISLLDLLNETLEKNTSLRATDLHSLSLFNIKKPMLERGPLDEFSDDDNEGDDETEMETEHSLHLKRTLLDSLAQPFYERNITFMEGPESMVDAAGELENSQPAISEAQQVSEDYRRILRTFASAKNSAPQAIFTCSQQYPWQFKAANDLACLIFGISNNVLKALTLLDLIHTDYRNFVLHKILSTEDQELAFTGEIIGIVQPGSKNTDSKNNLVWASIWAKRKNGLLVCVFERVPCDYVDISLDLDNYEVDSVLMKNNNNILEECMNFGGRSTPKFQLGDANDDKDDDTDDDDEDSDTDLFKKEGSPESNNGHVRKTTQLLHVPDENEQEAKKVVKFVNELQYVSTLSQSLAEHIDDIRQGKVKSPDDDMLSMPVRVSNHINELRYFTLNHLSSNIPCAVSSSILQNAVKLKIHSLPYIAGLFVIDSQSLQLVSFNRSVSKNMFGLHYNELVNKSITTIIPEFNDMIDYIECNYPELDISLSSNRGLVLTEHFFRKINADMNNDPEYFYTSIGIDGRHRDGSLIKVDIQLRVVSSSISLIWITHSRDVKLDDYQTNVNQLNMLKENELEYVSTNSSSTSLSRRQTPKEAENSLLKESLLKESPSRSYTSSPSLRKNNYSVSTSSTITSQDSKESVKDKEGTSKDENVDLNHDEIQEPEVKRKLELARMYTKDKSQFVKDGNFKVDQNLIISKIGTMLTLTDADGIQENLENGSSPEAVGLNAGDSQGADDEEEPATTFLRTPSHHIGSHKHSKKFSDFIILQKMGEGAYGKVNLCLHKTKRYIVVIKMIFKERILVDTWVRDRTLGTIPSEIQIMATLNKKPQENILRLLDFFEDDDYYYIETPVHGETGCIDLFDLIEFKTNMTELEAKLIFKQVVSGIRHLHKHGIVHRDIKDENVIVDSKGFVKLIDFGSATYVKSGPFDVFVGTIDYAAPEVLSGDPYEGKPQDIWAIGILLYTIIYKENPFYNIDEILEGELKIVPSDEISSECVSLIRRILNRNVQKRPVIEEIYDDPWLVI